MKYKQERDKMRYTILIAMICLGVCAAMMPKWRLAAPQNYVAGEMITLGCMFVISAVVGWCVKSILDLDERERAKMVAEYKEALHGEGRQ